APAAPKGAARTSGGSDGRGRGGHSKARPGFCQAVDCGADLSQASHYLRRYRICKIHLRAPVVMLETGEARFCQQCGRFHDVSAFDDEKRSCRERLSRHNALRRRNDGRGAAGRRRSAKRRGAAASDDGDEEE
ncbi:MAG: SBP domain-containing protein, partial [Monoraphidium minutum]